MTDTARLAAFWGTVGKSNWWIRLPLSSLSSPIWNNRWIWRCEISSMVVFCDSFSGCLNHGNKERNCDAHFTYHFWKLWFHSLFFIPYLFCKPQGLVSLHEVKWNWENNGTWNEYDVSKITLENYYESMLSSLVEKLNANKKNQNDQSLKKIIRLFFSTLKNNSSRYTKRNSDIKVEIPKLLIYSCSEKVWPQSCIAHRNVKLSWHEKNRSNAEYHMIDAWQISRQA